MKAPPDIINTRNMKREKEEKEEKRGCHSAARGAPISLLLRILLLASKVRQACLKQACGSSKVPGPSATRPRARKAYREQACESPRYRVRLPKD